MNKGIESSRSNNLEPWIWKQTRPHTLQVPVQVSKQIGHSFVPSSMHEEIQVSIVRTVVLVFGIQSNNYFAVRSCFGYTHAVTSTLLSLLFIDLLFVRTSIYTTSYCTVFERRQTWVREQLVGPWYGCCLGLSEATLFFVLEPRTDSSGPNGTRNHFSGFKKTSAMLKFQRTSA
jgi:hypothetical protein